MSKLLLWFFIYTVVTFFIGIICKVLVAWHVNEMHSDLEKTRVLFHTAAEQGGSFKDVALLTFQNGKVLTLGDLMSLDYLGAHQNDVSAGDGTLDRFWIYSKHISGNEAQFEQLKALVASLSGGNPDFASLSQQLNDLAANGLDKVLEPVAGFQSDITRDAGYALSMRNEANLVFWLQIILIFLTLAAYPYGIYKLWLVKHYSKYQYDAKMHTRLIVEYLLFLLFFIAIDTYATYLLIAEKVPMTFWNAFSVGSMAIPTGFAIGSLFYIHFLKKLVVNPKELKFAFLNKIKIGK